jgi:hypothetical protein
MHLNTIMKLGLCTIPHFEDITPCNILDKTAVAAATTLIHCTLQLQARRRNLLRTLDVLESIDDRCEGGIFAYELCMHLCRNLLHWQSR